MIKVQGSHRAFVHPRVHPILSSVLCVLVLLVCTGAGITPAVSVAEM